MANLKWKWRPWGFEDSPRKWDCVDIRWWNRGNMFGRCWLLFCIVCWNNRMISWKGLRSHWSVVFLCELWDSEFMVWYLNSGCNQEGLTIQRKTENHRSIRSDFLNVHKFNLKESIWIALALGIERKHCGIRISSSWIQKKWPIVNEMKDVRIFSYQGRLLMLCMFFGLEVSKQIPGNYPPSSQGMHRFHCRQSTDPIESLQIKFKVWNERREFLPWVLQVLMVAHRSTPFEAKTATPVPVQVRSVPWFPQTIELGKNYFMNS